MIDIIGHRRLWYSLSLVVLVVAAVALVAFRLKLGIDFTGGSVLEVKGKGSQTKLINITEENQLQDTSINSSGASNWLIRYQLDEGNSKLQNKLEASLKKAGWQIVRFDQVGPSISRDLVRNAILAIGLMSAAVVLYISWAFRRIPKQVSAFKFGLATLVAAFGHDALFVLGIFAVMGKWFGVEVDSYIVTAILTVIGFSIHDTIVVFDRIREKLNLVDGKINFVQVVNQSINETLVRSLNTSLVIILVLLALFLFGGASTRYFVLALLLGMVAGTYSSIFIASPLLVSWHRKRFRQS